MPTPPRDITLRFLAEATDANLFGNVHGGSVMKWIDQAGYVCAAGWSGQFCVTVYVGGIRFYQPIHIGHVVEVRARLIYTGRTSMHVAVDVKADDPRAPAESPAPPAPVASRTTFCVLVFVAVDAAGRPVEVPAWEPSTDDDRALRDYAVKLMELRKGIEREIGPGTG